MFHHPSKPVRYSGSEKPKTKQRTKRTVTIKKKYNTYEEFLVSPEWKRIRKFILLRDDGKCRICNNPATQIHHLMYTTKAGIYHTERLFNLIAICQPCHDHWHYKKDLLDEAQVDDEWLIHEKEYKDKIWTLRKENIKKMKVKIR